MSFPNPMSLCSAKTGAWLWQAEARPDCPCYPQALQQSLEIMGAEVATWPLGRV